MCIRDRLEHVAAGYARVIAFAQEQLPSAADNATGVGSTHPLSLIHI